MHLLARMLASQGSRDDAAMARVKQDGDPAAFAQLLARWQAPILRLCTRMTGDHHRAQDLTQETFARVFASRESFDSSRRFSTWVWRIALNSCHEESRRMAIRSRDELVARPMAISPRDHLIENERVRMVKDALSRLDERDRAIVVLREYEQMKFREIAVVLEMPEGTVKWRMAEALRQLSQELAPVVRSEEGAAGLSPMKRERLAL